MTTLRSKLHRDLFRFLIPFGIMIKRTRGGGRLDTEWVKNVNYDDI